MMKMSWLNYTQVDEGSLRLMGKKLGLQLLIAFKNCSQGDNANLGKDVIIEQEVDACILIRKIGLKKLDHGIRDKMNQR